MTEHTTFQAEHPLVRASHFEDGKQCVDLQHPYIPGAPHELTPDEAIALGYALFSIGLSLKQPKGIL